MFFALQDDLVRSPPAPDVMYEETPAPDVMYKETPAPDIPALIVATIGGTALTNSCIA